MSVKSTIYLTRSQAEQRYVEHRKKQVEIERILRAEAVILSDRDLEDALEALKDRECDGEGFENYIIDNRASEPEDTAP